MRYWDYILGMETHIKNNTSIPSTDDRVKNFFKPLPDGKKLHIEENVDGKKFPHIIDASLRVPVLDINGNWVEGVDQSVIDQEVETNRINSIKAKANELIEAKYPLKIQIPKPDGAIDLQVNIVRKGGVALDAMNAYIDGIIAISNTAETEGTALTDIDWTI